MVIKEFILNLLHVINMDEKEVKIKVGRDGEEYDGFVFVHHEDRIVIELYNKNKPPVYKK